MRSTNLHYEAEWIDGALFLVATGGGQLMRNRQHTFPKEDTPPW